MTENEIKALWIAQYLGQKVFMMPDWESFNDNRPMEIGYSYLVPESHYLKSGFLLLRTVDMLTDEELNHLAKLIDGHITESYTDRQLLEVAYRFLHNLTGNRNYVYSINEVLKCTDYLRSIGILLPFTYLNSDNQPVTLQPADILAKGWAKIKGI